MKMNNKNRTKMKESELKEIKRIVKKKLRMRKYKMRKLIVDSSDMSLFVYIKSKMLTFFEHCLTRIKSSKKSFLIFKDKSIMTRFPFYD